MLNGSIPTAWTLSPLSANPPVFLEGTATFTEVSSEGITFTYGTPRPGLFRSPAEDSAMVAASTRSDVEALAARAPAGFDIGGQFLTFGDALDRGKDWLCHPRDIDLGVSKHRALAGFTGLGALAGMAAGNCIASSCEISLFYTAG